MLLMQKRLHHSYQCSPFRIKNMVQSNVGVGKEYKDLVEREGEGKENVWSAIEPARIHLLC